MGSQLMFTLFYLCGNLFRIYLIYQFLKVFFHLKGERYQIIMRSIFFFLFFSVNSIGFLYFKWSPTIIMLLNFVGVFIITLSYSGNWKYRISSTIIIITLNLICEDLVYRLMRQLDIVHIAAVTIAVSDLLLLMIVLSLQKISDFRQGEDISRIELVGVVMVPVISIVISAVALDKCEENLAIAVGGIGLLLLNIFIFYLFDHLVKMHRKESQLLMLEGQNQAYEKQLNILAQSEENLASLRHDMRNHIVALQQMLKMKDLEELKKYLDKMLTISLPVGRFVMTGDFFIDGLLNLKLGEVVNKCQAELEYKVQLQSKDAIDKMDLNILLGNLLDNAIQALKNCKFKKQLKFFMEEKKGLLLIRIENSHEEKIKEKDGFFVTTKQNKGGHGIGLKNVRRIIDKYNGKININYTEQWFSIELIIFLGAMKEE
ncbi:GHKL domain-containing protein [Anaerovorax odorimutans]|uniref:GHKL domain-containing protein n=1 Tax=Anaerovorax odorimutans TaxID=109327 RepID=A0ABT1RTI1_9FIRM|nr:GHKL domain-containing protein [Anaerovorax odorimutans]MCQ4638518.1 GHKL domain-containing protein [Anaerovorax odorimutans]